MSEVNSPSIHAIVLAAGLSSRFGPQNKLIQPSTEPSQTIIEKSISEIEQSKIDKVTVVLGYQFSELNTLIKSSNVEIVHNSQYQKGMVTSIIKGMETDQLSDVFMICQGDQPYLMAKDYNELIDFYTPYYNQNPKCFTRPIMDEHRIGNPVLLPIYFKDLINSSDNLDSCKSVLSRYSQYFKPFSTINKSYFLDIDWIQDYSSYLENT